MQEPLDEEISLLIDDELDSKQALSILEAIHKDELLKSKIQRYQLIRQVLRNEDCYLLNNDFAGKIQQQIRKEPTYFIPSRKSKTGWQKIGLAVAASVVLAVAWIVNKIDKHSTTYPEPQIALTAPPPIQADAMVARFGDYLQAHDNDVYFNNTLRVQPYSRVVDYRQE